MPGNLRGKSRTRINGHTLTGALAGTSTGIPSVLSSGIFYASGGQFGDPLDALGESWVRFFGRSFGISLGALGRSSEVHSS